MVGCQQRGSIRRFAAACLTALHEHAHGREHGCIAALRTPAVTLGHLKKKNPEAGALGAPVRRLLLTGRGGIGGRDRPVGPSAERLASPPGQRSDAHH